jgi:hypothetical protein
MGVTFTKEEERNRRREEERNSAKGRKLNKENKKGSKK